jgi:DNA-binding GntR family transcriptional regulator
MRVSAHTVGTAIRDDIVHGVLPPGYRLTEELLSRRYGVSRVRVREALRLLEAEGFVTTRRRGGGAGVARPTERDAADLLDLRAVLEPLGAARAAERRTDAELKVLGGLVRLGRQRAERGDLSELRPLDAWFHETLAQASGSPTLSALLLQTRRKITWIYPVEEERGPAAAARARSAWREYGAIVDALTRRDAARARALTAAHVERLEYPRRAPRPTATRTAKHAVNTTGPRP